MSLSKARAMASDLHAAKTLQDLDRLYVEWIGYSIVEDDPEASFENVNDILQGYLHEVCYSMGVPYIDAVREIDAAPAPYTHAVVAIRGGRIFTGPLPACEQHMLDAGGEAFGWRIVTIDEAQRLDTQQRVSIREGSILW